MGPQVRMERDRTTRSGARAPGVERQRPLERRCFSAQRPSAQNGDPTRAAGSTKGGGKPSDVQAASNGQALSDTPALKPYWGKPAVRNFREGNGNVGIIRSPLRAIALPDQSLEACLVLAAKRMRSFAIWPASPQRPDQDRGLRPSLSTTVFPAPMRRLQNADAVRVHPHFLSIPQNQ